MAADSGGHHDFPTRGPAVLAVVIAMLVCSTVFVAFRMISRFCVLRRAAWDDYFMILAWLIAFGLSFAICYGVSFGLGRHEIDVPEEWSPTLRKAEYAFAVLYNPALIATKTSILTFYLSLSRTSKIFKWSTVATLTIVIVAGLALTILTILQCRPMSAAFQRVVPQTAHCTDIVTLYLSSAPVNIVTDLAILFLPMPILTSMRLPKKQKRILIITFSFGVFVAVVDVVRIAYLQSAAAARLKVVQENGRHSKNASRNSEVTDLSWYASFSFMWSAVEVHVGIMCACVPALKPLISRFLPHILRDPGESMEPELGSGTVLQEGTVEQGGEPASPQRRRDTAPAEHSSGTQATEESMDMMDFLTTPGMLSGGTIERTPIRATCNTTRTAAVPTFFDFVNLRGSKSLVHLTNKESIFPIIVVTLLFFIWGFAYGLLNILNVRFQLIARMSPSETLGIYCMYYLGYFVSPLTFGRLLLKRWGFKACFVVGLVIYACGTLTFWPSAVLTSFTAFLFSNFIVGTGLGTLEVAANPFIALCGPMEHAEARLNLCQGIQAIGGVCSPLLARKVLFTQNDGSLIDVQWTYLGIALFVYFLAIAYYYVPLPEASDQELEELSSRITPPHTTRFVISSDPDHPRLTTSIPVAYITLGFAVFAQCMYVGGQEVISTHVGSFRDMMGIALNDDDYQALGHTAFAVSRLSSAFALFLFPRVCKPLHQVVFFITGCLAFSIAALFGRGPAPAASYIMIYFFEGPMYSLIYAMGLRGCGKHTKDAAAFITAAVSSSTVFPSIAYAAGKRHTMQYAICVAVANFGSVFFFPLWLFLNPTARAIIEPARDERRPGFSRRNSHVGTGWMPGLGFDPPLAGEEEGDGNCRRDSGHGDVGGADKRRRWSSITKLTQVLRKARRGSAQSSEDSGSPMVQQVEMAAALAERTTPIAAAVLRDVSPGMGA